MYSLRQERIKDKSLNLGFLQYFATISSLSFKVCCLDSGKTRVEGLDCTSQFTDKQRNVAGYFS